MQYEFQKPIVVVEPKKKYNQKEQGLQQHQWQWQYICGQLIQFAFLNTQVIETTNVINYLNLVHFQLL